MPNNVTVTSGTLKRAFFFSKKSEKEHKKWEKMREERGENRLSLKRREKNKTTPPCRSLGSASSSSNYID